VQDITKIARPKKGQVVFMHFLSPKSYREYQAKGERYSHNDAVEDDHAIDTMLQSIGRTECMGKPFLSMFAMTCETYKAVLIASRAYGELYRAFVLDPTELAKHKVIVFNGDVKNLTQPGKLPSSVLFVGDEASTAEAILGWRTKLDVHARKTFFSEVRLYRSLSASLVKEEYGYPGSENELASALENAFEDEDTDL
jgi:hypothetical protein